MGCKDKSITWKIKVCSKNGKFYHQCMLQHHPGGILKVCKRNFFFLVGPMTGGVYWHLVVKNWEAMQGEDSWTIIPSPVRLLKVPLEIHRFDNFVYKYMIIIFISLHLNCQIHGDVHTHECTFCRHCQGIYLLKYPLFQQKSFYFPLYYILGIKIVFTM